MLGEGTVIQMLSKKTMLCEPVLNNSKLMSLIFCIGKGVINYLKVSDPDLLKQKINLDNWTSIKLESFGKIWEALCTI